jgi:hypothetical protein
MAFLKVYFRNQNFTAKCMTIKVKNTKNITVN